MHEEYLMGNEAVALGAIAAGVKLVAGYPGTPSTEVLETVASRRMPDTYVEWSVNEKTAVEVAAGAAMSGGRALVTMKQMGLNVASDPVMSLEYLGIKGGMIILVADDPGPISSQTEQDTRHFASFSKIPCFDPSSAQEAYEMVQDAFDFSEKYATPVFLRPTTRICHGYASVTVKEPSEYRTESPEGFIKDPGRWVIFPGLSLENHRKIESRNIELSEVFSRYDKNAVFENGVNGAALCDKKDTCLKKIGIAAGGISYSYVLDSIERGVSARIFKVATPYPFPEELALRFLSGLDEVLCVEELDPVIERNLTYICGKHRLPVRIRGKLSGDIQPAGENTIGTVSKALSEFLFDGRTESRSDTVHPAGDHGSIDVKNKYEDMPPLPLRPPVLCAGCPHRASFYAVKCAMKGKKTIYCGDIGCYTLGNAMPLDMVDTCLCMGAGLGISQGVGRIERDTACFAFVGDSTFFASAIPGVVNAVYNQAQMTLVVLDNSTTAMTGHQPHPGTGRTMMGQSVEGIDIEKILRGIGLEIVETIDPFNLSEAIDKVRQIAGSPGVKAIIFKSACIALFKPETRASIDHYSCTYCRRCIRELGCPALYIEDQHILIDSTLCTGCGLCGQLCPSGAFKFEGIKDNR